MADGVSITAGSGTKILTDDTGTSGHAQVVKLAISADGDGTLLPADASNGLDVDVTRVTGTVTTADNQVLADNAGFTDGTSKVWPVGLIYDEVAGTALTENDVATPRIDSKRATIGVIEDATTRGRRATVTASGELTVTGSITSTSTVITSHTPGNANAQLGKAEDDAHVSGDTGVAVWSVRQSEANSLSSTAGSNGDYAAFNTDTRGLLQVVARPYRSRLSVASSGLTTASTAYAIGDTAGTQYTFAGAARVAGGTGTIEAIGLLDKGDVGVDYRIHIYRASITLASDNAAWAVSDADQDSWITSVTMPSMADVGANRTAYSLVGSPYDCNATSLFVGVETRTANGVYAAGTDLVVMLYVVLD